MSQIVRRPAANRDLVAVYQYCARNAGLRVADRFFAEAEATVTRLANMPGLGTRYEPNEPNPAPPVTKGARIALSAYQIFRR
jgi:plasmid stabilization system protein ParE